MLEPQEKNVPKLSEKQLLVLANYGTKIKVKANAVLINEGVKNFDFYVILKGKVAIYDPFNPKKPVAIHKKNGFTGDSDMLSDRASIFRAVALTDVEVLKIPQTALKKILLEDASLNTLLISAFLLRRENISKNEGGVILIGSKFSSKSFEARDFLTKNHIRHTWLELEKDDTTEEITKNFNINKEDIPILISTNLEVLRKVTIEDIAFKMGLSSPIHNRIYQVMVVGAGPAGLAASVYGASEGLDTIALDKLGPGGQAGTTSKIENYLGFPTGISGSELANKAYLQAQKFGCTISIPCEAKKLSIYSTYFELTLSNDSTIKSKSVIAATGAKYRDLAIENISYFKGRGVYHSATAMEASNCKKEDVIVIVGGGNSAGQAAIFMADYAIEIHILIRGKNLSKSMSSYLINRINSNPKIKMHPHTEIFKLEGDNYLERIHLKNNLTKEVKSMEVNHLFLFLGAIPTNNWLPSAVCKDSKGFIITGNDLTKEQLEDSKWPLERSPFPLETCIPGLFATGDLRSESTKRVASSVGEGAMAISYIHSYLKNY
ncbi:FAD-dependent oxidoreductase [Cellulophaga baltica]|uniref:FAD-dependent oxidoreductase n=1 Tax=Cellulophaga baltica TaxID=76594 RepID=UPI002148F0D7|nr:FAD-dependent oxidoreductase [Cellulophaga baltica]MCR1025146.1 FAD-dependent oxidoreductase [Cellulophaga baltica]